MGNYDEAMGVLLKAIEAAMVENGGNKGCQPCKEAPAQTAPLGAGQSLAAQMDSSPDAIAARAAGKEVSASCCSTAECCTTAATGIPVGVSNRHLHLSEQDLATLFGEGYEFTRIKDLSQPGQYACKELVTICGPKGAIEKVRVLGPARSKTQVEILKSDSFKLGISAPTRISGDLEGTPGVTIIGPKGSVQTKEGLIISQRHIHMTPGDAANYGVTDGQLVDICVEGERGGIYKNVIIRANDASALECHVDNDEANAMDINSKSVINIIK